MGDLVVDRDQDLLLMNQLGHLRVVFFQKADQIAHRAGAVERESQFGLVPRQRFQHTEQLERDHPALSLSRYTCRTSLRPSPVRLYLRAPPPAPLTCPIRISP